MGSHSLEGYKVTPLPNSSLAAARIPESISRHLLTVGLHGVGTKLELGASLARSSRGQQCRQDCGMISLRVA